MTHTAQTRPLVWILFGATVLALAPTWWRVPGMVDAQGALALVLVGYLVWRDGPSTLARESASFAEGAIAVFLASLLWAAAVLTDVGVVHFAMALAVPALWVLTVRGGGAVVPVVQIVLTAALAVPLWAALTVPLRVATAFMSGYGSRLLGIQAEIGVFTIALESGTLRVAGGCAGLGFLLAAMTLAAAYGHLFVPRWRVRLQIVLVAAAAAIVGNWLRVGILVVVADVSAMESPLVTDHNGLGWIVWVICMIPAYRLAQRLERRGAGVVEDVDQEETEQPATRTLILATTGCALVGPALWLVASLSPQPPADVTSAAPLGVDVGWTSRPTTAQWAPAYHGVDASSTWVFEVDGTEVHGGRYAFEDQRPGEELVQGANRLVDDEGGVVSERVTPTGVQTDRIVNEAIVRSDSGPLLVWYWYRVAGAETPFRLRAKFLEVVAKLTRAAPSELDVLYAACGPNDCREAAVALRRAVDAREGLAPPP